MMHWKSKAFVLFMSIVGFGIGYFILTFNGCAVTTNPDTGEKTYGLQPVYAEKIDTVAEGVETTTPTLVGTISAIAPQATPIVGFLGGVAVTLASAWKKWRTPLVEATNKNEKIVAGAKAGADVIEMLVKNNADNWAVAKPILRNAEKNGAIMPDKL